VVEIWVLWQVSGHKRGEGEVTGGWIKRRHDKLHDLNSSPDMSDEQIKDNEMGGAYDTHVGE